MGEGCDEEGQRRDRRGQDPVHAVMLLPGPFYLLQTPAKVVILEEQTQATPITCLMGKFRNGELTAVEKGRYGSAGHFSSELRRSLSP
jgi:hypothetical protein